MSKTGKKKINRKLILVLILIFFTLICMVGTLILVLKKEKENIKEPLSYIDFEEGLAQEYQLLNCNITEDNIEFYISGVKDSYYTAVCKNIENHMKIYSETKENANQENFKIYVYKNNTKNYINEKPETIINYHLYDKTCIIETNEIMPSSDKADGLLPYEFIDFDGTTLTVSMDFNNLSLLEKGKQMKVLYEIAIKENNLTDLILKIEDNKIVYIYNGNKNIIINETREINY